jgi:hypothetical protein
VAYIVTLSSYELSSIEDRLRAEQRLTKALPRGARASGPVGVGARIVLVLSAGGDSRADRLSRRLAWLGVVAQRNTVGAVDNSITIEPLRECFFVKIPFDGEDGLLSHLPIALREEFDQAAPRGGVGECGSAVWEAIDAALRARHPEITTLLDWLIATANPPVLDSNDPAHKSWQEQRDGIGLVKRISAFPPSALTAWQLPESRDAPYISGVIRQPVEQSLIEYDIRAFAEASSLFAEWRTTRNVRCDIHVLTDTEGRQLEIANVNATPVEDRLGSDVIYYYQPTHSFVLVQYKRLDLESKSIYVDRRLRSQLDRMEKVAQLSRRPSRASDWRLGNDSCFLRLAYWPTEDPDRRSVDPLAPGMYLPLSYVRLLLEDDCTLGPRGGRILGYKQVERHVINTQFVDLVTHGLAGTIGTSADQLRSLVEQRVRDGQSVVVGVESSRETAKERQQRTRQRGPRTKPYAHRIL